ncbi:hypothetical protein C900_01173 [Fulvivirga imtechensis AK7]|uniref:Uncharacterized protein n=1 Tax=Fulvivirga imtechensis AK7 TaxID=1237149 RepID=L8JKQ9_9BACT|nr:hypothetical protein [Fulvivirga imtechensis]ELR68094.1 hypothetical protein C900_01173 [Fulvivirga imtechensis AK7]
MFGLFKKKKKEPGLPAINDLDNNPLKEGDLVEALRYDLGQCKLLVVDNAYIYESLSSGKQVSWLKMIDASTDNQKVKKILS